MCGCVCSRGGQRARSGNRATLPTASLAPLALRGPRKQSREVLGETPSRKQSPYLSSARARGLARAVLALTAGSAEMGMSAHQRGREELGGTSLAGLKERSASSLSSCSPGTGLLSHPHKTPKGTEVQGSPKSESGCAAALLYRGNEVTVIHLHPVDLITEHENGYTAQFRAG